MDDRQQRPGRPRKWSSDAERMRACRARADLLARESLLGSMHSGLGRSEFGLERVDGVAELADLVPGLCGFVTGFPRGPIPMSFDVREPGVRLVWAKSARRKEAI
jgi:hypothetical protein